MQESMITALIFLAVAFISSTLGAVSGIGGGIIIKPALDALSGLTLGQINFLSGTTVLAMSTVSLLRSAAGRKNGGATIEGGRGTALALGAVFGGAGGKAVFSLSVSDFSPGKIGAAQSVILMFLTVTVLVYTFRKKSLVPKNIQSRFLCFFLGLGIGLVSAFLGIGGGPINIMAISFFLAMDTKTTALHSLYTVFLSQLASLLLSALSGGIPKVPPALLIVMIAGGIAGGLSGSRLLKKLRDDQADMLFRLVMIIVILATGYNFVSFVFEGGGAV